MCDCDPMCEWCGHERAGVRASQHSVCEWSRVCETRWVSGTTCAPETARVCEARWVSGTTCTPETARVCEARWVSGATCAQKTARVCEQPCGSEAWGVSETPRVSAPACVRETARVSERPCVRKTACVRSLCSREMSVGMREHAAASPGVNVSLMECSLGVVTRRSAWVERRRRLRQMRDKGRVAAVVALGTVPGWHCGERAVRSVQCKRPPRARLRE